MLNDFAHYPKKDKELRVEHEALFYYATAGVAKSGKKFDVAVEYYTKSIKMRDRIKEETYVVPFSFIAMAEIELLKEGESRLSDVEDWIEKAKGCSDYDFDNLLSYRIRRVEGMKKRK